MLTLTKGNKPIARVIGGSLDGKIIYIDEKGGEQFQGDPLGMLGAEFFAKRRKTSGRPLRESDINVLFAALRAKAVPVDPELIDAYHAAVRELESRSRSELREAEAKFVTIPNFRERDVLFIAGPSGSGKSTYAGNYIRELRRGRPDVRVVIISKIAEDVAFDDLNPARITLDDKFVSDPPSAADFKDCVVVFDDVDSLTDRAAMETAQALRSELLESGRHFNTYVVVTGHQVANYRSTRVVLNECTAVTIFPGSSSAYHLTYFLRNYFSLDKEQIKKVMSIGSRWITLYKKYPVYCVHERGVFLLNCA